MESIEDDSWVKYLAKIERLSHKDVVERAVKRLPQTDCCVVDCGCADGRNSKYLIQQGFNVHAFDHKVNAVNVCRMRFHHNRNFAVCLSHVSNYIFPPNHLVVAFSSLYFNDAKTFAISWQNLIRSIQEGGLFCGDFIGMKDTSEQQVNACVLKFSKRELVNLFGSFELLELHENETLGKDILGQSHYHHTFTVLAQKRQ